MSINPFDKLANTLLTTSLIVTNEFEKMVKRAGEAIASEAKRILTEKGHIDTGTLRASIRSITKKKGMYQIDLIVGTDVYYSVFVEFLPDGGYLWEAFKKKKGVINRYLKQGITSALKASRQIT